MSTAVKASVSDSVGWIELDGPDRLNAIGSSTYHEITSALVKFENNPGVGAVVIHGAGRVFCAGADIEEISSFADRTQFEMYIHGLTDALDVIAASPLPVIAAVHGAALGGGLELALACDLRLATPSTKLGLPEARLGVLPGAGGTQRLPRLIPAGVAAEMLMLGTPISGDRGHDLGLINRLSAPETLLADAAVLGGQLAAGSRQVPAAAKALLRRTIALSLSVGINGERAVATELFDSVDGREGFAAFLDKRPPAFTGK